MWCLCLLPLATWAQYSETPAVDPYDNLRDYTRKGRWAVGGTLAMKAKSNSEKDQLIRYVEADKSNNYSIKLDGAYAFRDFSFAGLGLLFGQSKSSGTYKNSDGVVYSEEVFGKSYSFRPFLKNLIPIDKKGRFNIISQIELWYQHDQNVTQRVQEGVVTRKLSNKYTGLLGVRPGINVFVIKNVAMETTLNVAGISYSRDKIKSTDNPDTIVESGSIDFKIDILQLNIGVFVYL